MSTPPAPLLDYHVHSKLCGHGAGEMEEYVRYAVQSGMPEMGFSEHIFMYWQPEDQRDPELAMSEAQHEPYVCEVERLRAVYPEIRLKLGLEADFIAGHEARLREVLRGYEWDYLIGSVHFIDGWGVDDERYIDGFKRWDIDELYETYFDHVCRAAETGIYQVMGHLDLVKKFGHLPARPLADLYQRTARRLKAADVCIEVNTSGLRKPCAEMYPHPDLVKACFDAGVPVTLGSDAHQPDRVGDAALQAVAMLRDVGYTHIVRFDRQRRELGMTFLTDPHELLEIWTPEGQPTGQGARRGEVHLQGLWHCAFYCWVARPGTGDVEILLQHRSVGKDVFPGCFNSSAAGHMRLGESMAEAVRELHEELGLTDTLADLVAFGTHRQEHIHPNGLIDREHHALHLLARPIDDAELHPSTIEVQGLAWVPGETLIGLAEHVLAEAEVHYLAVADAAGRLTPDRRILHANEVVPYDGPYHRRVVDLARAKLARGEGEARG